MPKNQETLNRKLYNTLLRYEPDTLDSDGKITPVPEDAEVFQFKFPSKEDASAGNEGGTVAVSIEGSSKLVIYFDDSVTEVPGWSQLLISLKNWAQGKQLGFQPKNRNHLNPDMAKRKYMTNKEKVAEGYYATGKKSSYSDAVPAVKIILQHNRQLEEGEARYRSIAKIFVENADGERFLLPTNKPGIARVFARHIAEGGTPYDDAGKHINSLVEEYTKMAGFVRATRNNQFNESTQSLVNEGIQHYQSLRETLHKMSGRKGYQSYFESWSPTLTEDADDTTDLSEMFSSNSLDPRIESVMPILRKLNKSISEMTETTELSNWADDLVAESMGDDLEEDVTEGSDPTTDSARDARGDHRGGVKKNKDGSYVATNASGSRKIFKSEKAAKAHANSGQQGVAEGLGAYDNDKGIKHTRGSLLAKLEALPKGSDDFEWNRNRAIQHLKQGDTLRAKYYMMLMKRGEQGVAEGDTQEPKGRVKSDGTRSHSTYGSRDNYKLGGPESTVTPVKSKDVKKDALNILNQQLKKKGVAEAGLKFNGGIPDVDHMRGSVMRGGEGKSKVCPHCNGNRYVWTNSEQGKTPNHPWINPNTATLKSKQIPCPTCDGGKKKVAEAEKNPHTSALGKALYRDLSKEKKASPEQVEKNKANWAKNPHNPANKEQGVAENGHSPNYVDRYKKELERKTDKQFHPDYNRDMSDQDFQAKLIQRGKERDAREQDVAEDLDANQKRVGQLGPQEKAETISPVLGSNPKQHPFKGKLVGADESIEEATDLLSIPECDKEEDPLDRIRAIMNHRR